MTQAEKDQIIKELQEKLAEAEKIEVDKPKPWRPGFDEEFWYVDVDGRVKDAVSASDMRSRGSFECWCHLTGNCFKTENEAEEYKKQIEYTAKYKNYIEEHSEPLDWKDSDKCKYAASYNFISEEIDIGYAWSHKNQGIVYASSEQILLDAICKIGRSNFKKYVVEVK